MQWTIEQLDCYPEKEGETDVVVRAHWTLTDTDGLYSGKVYGVQSIKLNPNEPFTPYDQLTETQVVGWVQNAMGAEQVATYQANVLKQIENQKNPPIVTPPLPW